MRYVCMHKVGPTSEAGLPPSPELVAGMGQLIGETAKAGMFLAGGGLKPSRDRLRLTFALLVHASILPLGAARLV